jgi:hypothetical protein
VATDKVFDHLPRQRRQLISRSPVPEPGHVDVAPLGQEVVERSVQIPLTCRKKLVSPPKLNGLLVVRISDEDAVSDKTFEHRRVHAVDVDPVVGGH